MQFGNCMKPLQQSLDAKYNGWCKTREGYSNDSKIMTCSRGVLTVCLLPGCCCVQYLISNLAGGGKMRHIVVEGHEQLGAQQAVARLIRAHIQPLALLELAHAQVHHGCVHLQCCKHW